MKKNITIYINFYIFLCLQQKDNLCRFIDTYIENQIGKAAEAISYSVQEKISNGDVILTFGW